MSEQLEHQPGFVPLSYCINQALVELEDYTERQRERFTVIAIAGYRELNFTVINSIKVVYLQMDDILNVKLPTDYIRYIKIGMPIGNRIWNLTVDDTILLGRSIACGEDANELFTTTNPTPVGYGYFFTGHYRDGQYINGLYGVGGGYRKAYFKVDKERGVITFDAPVPRSTIVLEYKSDGISAQTLVPKEAINTIVAYIHWRRNVNKDNATRERFKIDFLEEERALKSLNAAFNVTEYLDMMYDTTYQTAKR
jgi:hypothetical protein